MLTAISLMWFQPSFYLAWLTFSLWSPCSLKRTYSRLNKLSLVPHHQKSGACINNYGKTLNAAGPVTSMLSLSERMQLLGYRDGCPETRALGQMPPGGTCEPTAPCDDHNRGWIHTTRSGNTWFQSGNALSLDSWCFFMHQSFASERLDGCWRFKSAVDPWKENAGFGPQWDNTRQDRQNICSTLTLNLSLVWATSPKIKLRSWWCPTEMNSVLMIHKSVS